jgi:hypothetical protein
MFNPQSMYEKAIEAAEDYADKDHAAGVLEDALDALKGVIASELKAKGEAVGLISNLTKKDPRWIEMTKSWRDARKEALIAKMKYDQINRFQDNERTQEATARRLAT